MHRTITGTFGTTLLTGVLCAPLAGCDASVGRSAAGSEPVGNTDPAASALTWAEQKTLVASDGVAQDGFGSFVAIDGATAVVGAPFADVATKTDQGSAYVFGRSGTTWTELPKLLADDGSANDQFGGAVAISGDTVVVGAPFDTTGANTNQGAAYVFVRNGSTFEQQAKLVAADGVAFDRFGGTVAVSGNTAVVGAYQADVTADLGPEGAAYVFTRSGTTWSPQAKLVAPDSGVHNFGISVAVSGDVALVGSPNDLGLFSGVGAAYVFTRSGTTWSPKPKLSYTYEEENDYFGYAVALSGDTAVVGSYGAPQVHVFVQASGTWSLERSISGADRFGYSVSVDGDALVIGGIGSQFVGNPTGSAQVYFRTAGTWNEEPQLYPDLLYGGDGFGRSVGISGTTVLVSAPASNSQKGSAHVFGIDAGTGGAGGSGGSGGSGGAEAGEGGAGATSGGNDGGANDGGTSGASEGGSSGAGEGGAGESGTAGNLGGGGAGRGGTTGRAGGASGTSGASGAPGVAGSASGGSGTAGTAGTNSATAGGSAGASSSGRGNGGATGGKGASGSAGTSTKATPTAPRDDRGCGCRVPLAPAPPYHALSLLGLLLGALHRRRRR